MSVSFLWCVLIRIGPLDPDSGAVVGSVLLAALKNKTFKNIQVVCLHLFFFFVVIQSFYTAVNIGIYCAALVATKVITVQII